MRPPGGKCAFRCPAADDIQGDQRIAAAKAEVAGILAAMPELAAIHPWDAMGADEDIMLIDQTLLSTTAESLACVPSYRDWIHAQDLRPAYAYLVQLMKFLQWQKKRRGQVADYWVLKTPMHLGYVEVIAEQMPGATFVQTHRDPLATMPSFASFVHMLWAMGSDSAGSARGGAPVVTDARGAPQPLHGPARTAGQPLHRRRLPRDRGRAGAGRRAHLPWHRPADDRTAPARASVPT